MRNGIAMDIGQVEAIGWCLMGPALIEPHRQLPEAVESAGCGDGDNIAILRALEPHGD
jgi:hypothetical protein